MSLSLDALLSRLATVKLPKPGGRLELEPLAGSADALAIAQLASRGRMLVVITANPLDAQRLFWWTGPHLPAGWTAAFRLRNKPVAGHGLHLEVGVELGLQGRGHVGPGLAPARLAHGNMEKNLVGQQQVAPTFKLFQRHEAGRNGFLRGGIIAAAHQHPAAPHANAQREGAVGAEVVDLDEVRRQIDQAGDTGGNPASPEVRDGPSPLAPLRRA